MLPDSDAVPRPPRISILGMGNVLMGDDGAGPYTVASLAARYRFPENVTLLDIGTPGLDLSPYLAGADAVILIDTVQSDAPAGSLRTYDKAALLRSKLPPRLSPHDPAVGQCLASLEMAGCAPGELLLVGIVPERTAFGPGLSAPVQAAIPGAMDAVVDILATWGVEAELRENPPAPDIWWEVELFQPV